MTPIPYVPEEHFEQVRTWLGGWNMAMTPDALPKTGFIIPGKFAGFLYRTDSSLAWMEGLVAAPGLGKEERGEAIDAVVSALLEEARRQGFKMVMGYTQLDSLVKRSEKHGFVYVAGAYHLVARPL